ncbi:uncharacterized protein VTP21DRAFT_8706 [Calcarisporiella thermophila]|uniref:uncharacterized protein n=1 Tax=Calcarisporiella thermophila TaxID=911321 RepID=UPI00374238B2
MAVRRYMSYSLCFLTLSSSSSCSSFSIFTLAHEHSWNLLHSDSYSLPSMHHHYPRLAPSTTSPSQLTPTPSPPLTTAHQAQHSPSKSNDTLISQFASGRQILEEEQLIIHKFIIIFSVVGSLFVLTILIIAILMIWRVRKRKKKREARGKAQERKRGQRKEILEEGRGPSSNHGTSLNGPLASNRDEGGERTIPRPVADREPSSPAAEDTGQTRQPHHPSELGPETDADPLTSISSGGAHRIREHGHWFNSSSTENEPTQPSTEILLQTVRSVGKVTDAPESSSSYTKELPFELDPADPPPEYTPSAPHLETILAGEPSVDQDVARMYPSLKS